MFAMGEDVAEMCFWELMFRAMLRWSPLELLDV